MCVIISLMLAPVLVTCIAAEGMGPGNGGDAPLVAELSPSGYDTSRLDVGDQYYIDRTFTITSLGAGLANRLWIRTANDDGSSTAESFVSFTLRDDAVAVIGYDRGATSIPDWLQGWDEAADGVNVTVPAPASPLRLFYKALSAGPVSLGGNLAAGAQGAQSMYVIMLLRPSELGPVAIAVAPAGVALDPGESIQFTATVRDPLGRPVDDAGTIEWSATGGSITPQGLYTAGGSPGAFQVTASQAGSDLSNAVAVTVRDQSPGDVTTPVISNGEPTGSLAPGTTQATMRVTTNEAATCKWGTSSSTSYALLPNTFASTGGTSHATPLTGLTNGQSYTRYVRCEDLAGNANGSSYAISFSVASASASITGITFDAASVRIFAPSADLWPIAWGGDGNLYTAGGDGDGFQGPDTRGMTVARVQGLPTAVQGTDRFKKAGVLPTGIVALPGNSVYLIEQERGNGFARMRIGRSTNGGITWTYNGNSTTSWDYAEADAAFAHTSFVNHGQDDAGAPDGYVYAISLWPNESLGDRIDMFRVPRSAVQDRAQHEYFAGIDGGGNAVWTASISQRTGILARSNAVHWGARMTFNPVLGRYLLCFFVDTAGTFAVYEGPKPWGPWTKIHEARLLDTTEKYNLSFVNKAGWLSADGLTWWGVLSGLSTYDAFVVIKGTLTTR